MGRHLIHSQTLDLRYGDERQAKADMDQWGSWYQRELLPVIASVLDEVEIPGKTIRLERLEIDLGHITGKPDPDSLRRKLREMLKTQILRQSPELLHPRPKPVIGPQKTNVTARPKPSPELEQLIFLLEKGRAAWWSSATAKTGIRHLLKSLFWEEKNPALQAWLSEQPLSPQAVQRLAHHLDYSQLLELAKWVSPKGAKAWEQLDLSLKKVWVPSFFSSPELEKRLSPVLAEVFFAKEAAGLSAVGLELRAVFFAAQKAKISDDRIFIPLLGFFPEEKINGLKRSGALEELREKWLQSSFVRANFDSAPEKPKAVRRRLNSQMLQQPVEKSSAKTTAKSDRKAQVQDRKKTPPGLDKDETVLIANAGLVLTAPFLPYFFRGLGLVDKTGFVSTEAQHRAALLIQALLDESHEYEESDLLLNKILCGIAPEEAIPVAFAASALEKEEIPNLLDAMAAQWTALKSTSGQAMAQGFFPREGSLRQTDKGYLLHIPRTSIDILLNRLPWTLSIIKLPWMNETLFVEW